MFTNHRVISLGQLHDEVVCAGQRSHTDNRIHWRARVNQSDIFLECFG